MNKIIKKSRKVSKKGKNWLVSENTVAELDAQGIVDTYKRFMLQKDQLVRQRDQVKFDPDALLALPESEFRKLLIDKLWDKKKSTEEALEQLKTIDEQIDDLNKALADILPHQKKATKVLSGAGSKKK